MASSSRTADSAAGAACAAPAQRFRPAAVIGASGAFIGTAALVAGPFLSFRPNRVVDGITSTGLEAFGATGWLLLAAWLLAGALVFVTPGKRSALVRGLLGAAILAGSLWASGLAAAEYASAEGAIARTSFGWSFYATLLALFLVQNAAMEESTTACSPGPPSSGPTCSS
jgi:hypothetical protein